MLDWEPKVPLEQGLAATIAYFDDFLRQGDAVAAGAPRA
jgi:UDP-glucuronate decarboxylase